MSFMTSKKTLWFFIILTSCVWLCQSWLVFSLIAYCYQTYLYASRNPPFLNGSFSILNSTVVAVKDHPTGSKSKDLSSIKVMAFRLYDLTRLHHIRHWQTLGVHLDAFGWQSTCWILFRRSWCNENTQNCSFLPPGVWGEKHCIGLLRVVLLEFPLNESNVYESQVRNLFQCGTRRPLLTCENIAYNAFTNCIWEVLLTGKFNVR